MGANIFAPYIQQPKSVMDYIGEAEQRDMRSAQLQGMQRQNALAGALMQQQIGEAQDKQARRTALQRVLSDPAITTPQAREEAMFKDPLLMDLGQAAQKARLEADKLRADTGKTTAEADEKAWGLRVKKANTAITDIAALGSRDEAIASLTRHYQAGDIDQTKYQSVLATIPQDAAQFPAWRKQMLIRILDAKEQLEATKPVLQINNTGGETVTQAIDPQTGIPTVTGRLKNTQSPDNAASNARMAADAAAGRAIQVRGQDLADARARESNSASLSKPFEVTGPDGAPVLVQQTKDGRVVPVQGYAPKGGSPTKVSDAKEALALLDQAEPLIKGATGSNIGAGIDAAAKAFGVATPGSIKSQQLKALEGALVAKMPKMSGPQSDKDVMLYKQMAAEIGDPTVPYERKAAAMGTVREIQERYAGMAPGSSKPAPKAGGAFSDAEKERRYQEWKRQQGQ